MAEKTLTPNAGIDQMFKAGAHFGVSRSRRHPSTKPLIFGLKNRIEIFDLEKTKPFLDKAKSFVASIAKTNGNVLFVGGKSEAREIVKSAATRIGMPYVAGRWIGGTFTNFPQIKKRIERFETLTSQREKGELAKYTKKERLLIDREIENLNRYFFGIVAMKDMPKAMFVVDPKKEHIAVTEAHRVGIPVIGLMSSDSNMKNVEHPIPGNDASIASITYFVNEIANAYASAKANA